jgi:hypothetical protein
MGVFIPSLQSSSSGAQSTNPTFAIPSMYEHSALPPRDPTAIAATSTCTVLSLPARSNLRTHTHTHTRTRTRIHSGCFFLSRIIKELVLLRPRGQLALDLPQANLLHGTATGSARQRRVVRLDVLGLLRFRLNVSQLQLVHGRQEEVGLGVSLGRAVGEVECALRARVDRLGENLERKTRVAWSVFALLIRQLFFFPDLTVRIALHCIALRCVALRIASAHYLILLHAIDRIESNQIKSNQSKANQRAQSHAEVIRNPHVLIQRRAGGGVDCAVRQRQPPTKLLSPAG